MDKKINSLKERVSILNKHLVGEPIIFYLKNGDKVNIPGNDTLLLLVNLIEECCGIKKEDNKYIPLLAEAREGQDPPVELMRSMAREALEYGGEYEE